LTAV
jgi:hypothetical protein